MSRIVIFITTAVLILHGLIHLMGLVAYWPLAELAELPYKTTLAGERWAVGAAGMRFYSVIWLATAVSFTAAGVALLMRHSWMLPLLSIALGLSLVITLLDWNNAFRGAIISLIIAVPVFLAWGLRIPAPGQLVRQSTSIVPIFRRKNDQRKE